MTGTGTQSDPFIVTTWAEFVSVCNISPSTYVEWSDTEVDFNDIQPEGFTDRIVLVGNITLRNLVWRNMVSRSDDVFSFGTSSGGVVTIENCKIIDTEHITTESEKFFFIVRSGTTIIQNCEVSYRQDKGDTAGTSGFVKKVGGSFTLRSCAVTAKSYGNKNDTWCFLGNSVATIEFCNISLDVQAKTISYPLAGFLCWYSGKIDVAETNSISGSGYIGNIAINVECNYPLTLTATSPYKFLSVYNSDKWTITGNNCEGVTSEQLQDTAYLNALGFPAR